MCALTRLVSLGFMFVAVDFVCTVSFKKFTSVKSLNNKICKPQDRIFTVSVSSNADNQQGLTVCITHCISNHLCNSIFYNPVDLTCTACSGIYDMTSPLDDSTGSKYIVSSSRSYKEGCNYPNDYCMEPNQECFTDTCICSPGYSYNLSNKTCVDIAFKKFTSGEIIDNKICLPQDRIVTVSVPSYSDNLGLTVCVTHCITNGLCKSIFYNSVDSTCTACSGNYDGTSTLDESTGSKYYVRNSMSYQESCNYPGGYCMEPNQECFTDTCICSSGYSYNPSNKTCVETCSSYGTTFQFYPGRRIHGDNMYTLHGGSRTECSAECLSNALCASFDYSTQSPMCNIQNVTAKTTATYLEEISSFDYYARDCA